MFLNSASALDMLRSDSPSYGDGTEEPEFQQDPQAALEEQLQYALSCLKGWGCPVHLDPKPARVSDPHVLGSVVSGLVEALRKSQSEREQQQEATSRLQSDLRVLQSVRRRLEEDKEACARDLGSMKNKLLLQEDQSRQQQRQGEQQRDALQRQVKELKQRQVQQEHAIKRRDGELEQAQRQLQSNFRRSTSLQHAPAPAPAPPAPAGPPGGNRRDGPLGLRASVDCTAVGAPMGGETQQQHHRRNAARRVTAPAPLQLPGSPELLAQHTQHVSNLERELDAAVQSRDQALSQLHAVMAQADQLGFAPALTSGHQVLGYGQPGGSRAEGARPGLGRPGRVREAGGLAEVRERCARWLAQQRALRGCVDVEPLRRQVEEAGELLQQQSQVLESTCSAHRQQQEHAGALEARIMALEARLEAALLQGSAHGRASQGPSPEPSFRPASCSPAPAAAAAAAAEGEAEGSGGARRRRSLSAPGCALGGGPEGGREGGRGGGTPPPARRTWSREGAGVLASPKVQLRSSFLLLLDEGEGERERSEEEEEEEGDAAMDGSVCVEVGGREGGKKGQEPEGTGLGPEGSGGAFLGFSRVQQRRQHGGGGGGGGAERERQQPVALDLQRHLATAASAEGGDSDQTDTPVLIPEGLERSRRWS